MASIVQALMRQQQGSPRQNMTGPNALPTTPIDLFGMLGIQKPTNPQLPSNPFGQAVPLRPRAGARSRDSAAAAGRLGAAVFGSAKSGQYGNGIGLAQPAGWAQQNRRASSAGRMPVMCRCPR